MSGPPRDADADADADFDRFFDAVWPRAQCTGRRLGLGPAEAEDVAIEALAITYDRWSRVCPLGHREAWTLRVTANLALRRLRRRGREAALQPVGEARSAAAPDQQVADRLALRDALRTLSRRQREVAVLRYLIGLPEAEVAATLGVDAGTVKRHASRARQALQHALEPEDPS